MIKTYEQNEYLDLHRYIFGTLNQHNTIQIIFYESGPFNKIDYMLSLREIIKLFQTIDIIWDVFSEYSRIKTTKRPLTWWK